MPPPPSIKRTLPLNTQPNFQMYHARPRSPPHIPWLRSRNTPRIDKSPRPTYVEWTPQSRPRRPYHSAQGPGHPPDSAANRYNYADDCVEGGRPSMIVKSVDDNEASDQVSLVLDIIVADSILQSHSSRSTLDQDAIGLRGHGLKSMHLQEQPLFHQARKVLAPESRDSNIQDQGDIARSKETTTSKSSLLAYSPKITTLKFKYSLGAPLHLAKLISRASRDLLSKSQTRAPTARLGKRKGFHIAPVTFRGEVIGKPKNIDLELVHVGDAPRKAPAAPTVRITPGRASHTDSEATVVGECAENKWRTTEHGKAIHPVRPLTLKLHGPAFKDVSPSTPSVGSKQSIPLPCSPQRTNDVPLLRSTLSPRRSLPALSTRSTASVYSTTSIDPVHTHPHDIDDDESVLECGFRMSGSAFYFLPTESPDENGDWGFMDSDVNPERPGLPLPFVCNRRMARAL